jgi:hypothetical protein
MVKYDLLVYLGFIPVFATIIVAAFVIWATPIDVDPEVRKIRVADATLVGLLALFVFTARAAAMLPLNTAGRRDGTSCCPI